MAIYLHIAAGFPFVGVLVMTAYYLGSILLRAVSEVRASERETEVYIRAARFLCKLPGSCVVCTWALQGLPYLNLGVNVSTIQPLEALGLVAKPTPERSRTQLQPL